ncbi:MFS transporter [Streptomyces sp. NPDC127084]|uniref:MFS transporter n=1 Tax=Streptomyces sp. NPDC127084 TaxID=3347133 RepID=UPI0036625872
MCPAFAAALRRVAWSREQTFTVLAASAGAAVVMLDTLAVNVALPRIQAEAHVGERGLQWLVTSYSLGMAVGVMPSGILADRIGRKRLFMVSVALFAAGSLWAGLAGHLLGLVWARGLQGFAGAAITVTSLALVSAAFTDSRQRARAIGIWTALASVSLAFGPLVGGLLTQEWGWRSVFYVNLPVAVVALALAGRGVTESRGERTRGFDWLGQTLFVIAIGAVTLGVIRGAHFGWTTAPVVTAFAVSAAAGAGFVRRELRTREPMVELRLFGEASYATALGVIFLQFFTVYGMLFIVTQYQQNVVGDSPIRTGLLILPYPVMFIVLSAFMGRLMTRYPARTLVLTGQALLTAGLLIITLGIAADAKMTMAGLGVTGLGCAFMVTPNTQLAMATVPAQRSGMASGIINLQRALGSTLGLAVTGSILTASLGSTLDRALSQLIPETAERAAVVHSIAREANPHAYAGTIGPRRPIPEASPHFRELLAKDVSDAFLRSSRVSLAVDTGVAAAALLVLLVLPDRGHRGGAGGQTGGLRSTQM